MKNIILVSLAVILPFFSWAQKSIETPNYKLVVNDEWTEAKNQINGILMLTGPSKTDFTNNINVLVQSNLENMTLKNYVDLSEKQIKTVFQNAKIKQNKNISEKVQHIEYDGEIGGKKLSFMQRYIFAGQQVYVLTFTATSAEFEEMKKSVLPILESFQMK